MLEEEAMHQTSDCWSGNCFKDNIKTARVSRMRSKPGKKHQLAEKSQTITPMPCDAKSNEPGEHVFAISPPPSCAKCWSTVCCANFRRFILILCVSLVLCALVCEKTLQELRMLSRSLSVYKCLLVYTSVY